MVNSLIFVKIHSILVYYNYSYNYLSLKYSII